MTDDLRPPVLHKEAGLTVRGTNAQGVIYRDKTPGYDERVVGGFTKKRGRWFYKLNSAHGGAGYEHGFDSPGEALEIMATRINRHLAQAAGIDRDFAVTVTVPVAVLADVSLDVVDEVITTTFVGPIHDMGRGDLRPGGHRRGC